MYKLVVFDPGNAGYGVSESPIFQLFPGENANGPPYIIRGIGADSVFVSSVAWYLTFSYNLKQPPYLRQTNDDTESG